MTAKTSSYTLRRAVTGLLIAGGIGLAMTPAAGADPAYGNPGDVDPDTAGTTVELPAVNARPINGDSAPGVADACKQFSAALNYAATNYEDFAYDTAGQGNTVNYADGSVVSANSTGRTALRQAAAMSMSAASTPGVPPDVSQPMRAWSLRAAKLVLVMGLHGGGDTLNDTATDMNTNAHDVQLACAKAGSIA